MSSQLSFLRAEVPRSEGLFFGFFPDEAAAVRLSCLAQQQCIRHRLSGRPFVKDRFHVSLLNLGKHATLPRSLAIEAAEAAASVLAAPFRVTFDRVMSFAGRPCPLVLCGSDGVAELVAFQRRIGEALEETSFGRVKPRYMPHVTLLYDDRAVDAHTIEPIRWTVREFVLIHSLRGQSRYIPLGRWRLTARYAFS